MVIACAEVTLCNPTLQKVFGVFIRWFDFRCVKKKQSLASSGDAVAALNFSGTYPVTRLQVLDPELAAGILAMLPEGTHILH